MYIDGATLPELIALTLRDPRAAAARLLRIDASTQTLWMALLLVNVLSGISISLTVLLLGPAPASTEAQLPAIASDPMMMMFIQGCLLVLMVFVVHWVGRAFGGTGDFDGAIVLVTWVQFVLVCLQVVQSLAMLLVPAFAALLGIAGIVLFFWLLTQFLCVLHGFEQPGNVFVMIIVTMLGLAFALVIFLSILSLMFGVEAVNV